MLSHARSVRGVGRKPLHRLGPPAGSSASTCKAASPHNSANTGILLTTAGVPRSIASSGGSPNPSSSDGQSKQSADCIRERSSASLDSTRKDNVGRHCRPQALEVGSACRPEQCELLVGGKKLREGLQQHLDVLVRFRVGERQAIAVGLEVETLQYRRLLCRREYMIDAVVDNFDPFRGSDAEPRELGFGKFGDREKSCSDACQSGQISPCAKAGSAAMTNAVRCRPERRKSSSSRVVSVLARDCTDLRPGEALRNGEARTAPMQRRSGCRRPGSARLSS